MRAWQCIKQLVLASYGTPESWLKFPAFGVPWLRRKTIYGPKVTKNVKGVLSPAVIITSVP